MLRKFLIDRFFLMKHYTISILVLGIIIFNLPATFSWDNVYLQWLWFGLLLPVVLGGLPVICVVSLAYIGLVIVEFHHMFSLWHIVLIPLGVLVGLYSATFMHLAVHQSLGPRWFNRLIGELCALQQLLGYYGWGITHLLHHKNTDDPQRDPHPPGHRNYWEFSRHMKSSIVRSLDQNYYQAFGETNSSRKLWQWTKVLLVMNRITRVVFVLIVFGPIGFALFFLPSYVTQLAFYTHFNWATHRPLGDKRYGVFNLHTGLYYQIANAMLLGFYYHKNHHLQPGMINPKKLDGDDDPLVTFIEDK